MTPCWRTRFRLAMPLGVGRRGRWAGLRRPFARRLTNLPAGLGLRRRYTRVRNQFLRRRGTHCCTVDRHAIGWGVPAAGQPTERSETGLRHAGVVGARRGHRPPRSAWCVSVSTSTRAGGLDRRCLGGLERGGRAARTGYELGGLGRRSGDSAVMGRQTGGGLWGFDGGKLPNNLEN